MKPEINKDVQARVEEASKNFSMKFIPSDVTSGNDSIGYILLKNVLIMARDDSKDKDGNVIEGTAFVTPREKQGSGYYTGGHVLLPTEKTEEFYKLLDSVLSGKKSGGKPHTNYKASKVKQILGRENTEDQAIARSYLQNYKDNIEKIDELNEDREEKLKYSPFYQTLKDFSRIILKHYLDKDSPLSSKSFDWRDSLFMINGDAPIFGRKNLRLKVGDTWKENKVIDFDESTLAEMPQDYKESDVGSYAIADILIQVYCSTNQKNYYIGLSGKLWKITKTGFNLSSGGELALPSAVDDMFDTQEDEASDDSFFDEDVPF